MLHTFLLSGVALAPLLTPVQASEPPQAAVDELAAGIAGHIEVLSSDAFGGRGPGTESEDLTIDYLVEVFKANGLVPGGPDGSWRQVVSMLELTPSEAPVSFARVGGEPIELLSQRDVMIWSPQLGGSGPGGEIEMADSEFVFVGHGIVAPEADWNDYEGLDVRGKTVVALVNDPGFRTGDPDHFRGRSMTYYGRWTYKFEEAARQGAKACLLVHEEDAAGYGWQVVVQSWGRSQLQLASGREDSPTLVQGWIKREAAQSLFSAAGADLDALIAGAAKAGAKPVALENTTFEAKVINRVGRLASANVVAKIVGSKTPDEAVLVMAHWDHLGTRPGRDDTDNIFNGAVDNASGTAALLELSRLLASRETPPERSIVFVVTTAEEQGLLGSKFYASEPVVPLKKTVAGLNVDVANTLGPMRDMIVVGYGASELDDDLRICAKAQGRTLVPEPTPEKGYYFRSDHFSLAKVGVPMLYTSGGKTSVAHGADWVAEQKRDYDRKRYHGVKDEFDPKWDLAGAAQDVRLFHALVSMWSDEPRWREWGQGSEFRGIREASMRDK